MLNYIDSNSPDSLLPPGGGRPGWGLNQGTDYYPFGLEIPVYGTSDNLIKYNSKELQTDAGLTWYDYGARFYDPVLARWHSIDAKAVKYAFASPYSYVLNNPIKYIDPDGEDVWITIQGGSAYVGVGYGAGYSQQYGTAKDDYGKTFFSVNSGVFFNNDLKDGTSNPEFTLGGVLSPISFNTIFDWKSSSFQEYINSATPYEFTLGPVNIGFSDGKVLVGASVGIGYGLSSMKTDKLTSYSLTEEEIEQLGNINDVNDFSLRNIQPNKEGDGYYGSLYIKKLDEKGGIKFINTNIILYRNSNERIQMWESGAYKSEHEQGERL
jgi:RHS repeat-associated protein